MKVRYLLGTVVALLAIGATACGGGDDGGDTLSADDIQTQKGIVSAAGAAFGGENLEAAEDSALNAAPAPQIAVDGGGIGGDRLSVSIDAGVGFAPNSYLQATGAGTGITVQGYGTATAAADSAKIDFYFGKFQDRVLPFPEPLFDEDVEFGDADGATSSGGSGSIGGIEDEPAPPPDEFFDDGFELQEVEPITEADLQPVIDAITAAGVDGSDIEFVGQGYYDPYYASASLRVTVDDLDSIEAIIDAAADAAAPLETIELQNSNVSYSVSDCGTLQTAALETAIADAGDNGVLFADALGVGLGDIIGATNFSYFPTDGSACDSYYGYYPVYEDVGFRGLEEAEVQVYANVSVTYAIATP
ncbi:MAG: SIMPL domain-containing protein [Chloroflexi bacterium]|nr:SIMPL domain-containing protein [Chloroflexota bacterium]